MGRADGENVIVEAQVFNDIMDRHKISQFGTVVGEFSDVVVSLPRLADCAVDIKKARVKVGEEREQLSQEILQLIEGKLLFKYL